MNGPDLLGDVTAAPAYALLRLHGDDHVTLLRGRPEVHESLADVPLDEGRPDGRTVDRLVCMPFAQIRERGFAAHGDDARLVSIEVDDQQRVSVDELLAQLPDEPIATTGEHGFDIDDEAYADIVRRIIDDEIGNGEGANLVIARNYTATIADWDHAKALTVFRRLLERERGAYWTFVVFTGDRFLIGASPERHVSVQGGEVRMNPISGTFRVGRIGDPSERKSRLLEFLADEKEIYELFMVVDEELKMMCDICSEGGQILGPYLKPMTHLIHTEYILAGRTHRDVRDVLRSSMYAATVTGSPVENACRVIAEYEQQGRGYYGAVMALIGRDDEGSPTVDAPIILRTADVSPRRSPSRHRRGHARQGLRAGVRGRGDARQGRRHPHGLRTGAGAVCAQRRDRRPGARRGRAGRAGQAQPAAEPVLVQRPVRRDAFVSAGWAPRGRARRRGRLRDDAAARAGRARHDQRDGAAPRLPHRRLRRR